MKYKALSVLAITTVTASATYAGSDCDYMRGTSQTQATMKPAAMTKDYEYHSARMRNTASPQARAVYAMHHGGGSGHEMTSAPKTSSDIVDTAVSAGSFNTLVEAIEFAGLAETLKGEGPYTVFAPTDEAFAKLPKGTLEGLLIDKQKLVKVLTYHVVSGRITTADLSRATSLKSLEGTNINVSNITLSAVDIDTSNGVIHVVDEVLIPQK